MAMVVYNDLSVEEIEAKEFQKRLEDKVFKARVYSWVYKKKSK